MLAVLVAAKFGGALLFTSANIATKNVTNSGWNGARTELRRMFEKELGDADMDPSSKSAFLDCVTTKAIDYLNQTSCSYLYNKALTSREQHMRDQDACIHKTGYAKAIEDASNVCVSSVVASH